MRISSDQGRILSAIEFNARAPLKYLAKNSGVRAHTLSYQLKRLASAGIIGSTRASIDTFKLGYSDFHIVFAATQVSQRREFISRVVSCSEVCWFAEIGGDLQYALTVRSQSVNDVMRLLRRLEGEFPGYIGDQKLSINIAISSYGRRYLSPKSGGKKIFEKRLVESDIYELSSVDKTILDALSNKDISSERDLARKCGISLGTAQRHINLLEKLGVVLGYYYHIDTTKLGYQSYKILINSGANNDATTDSLKSFARLQQNVVHLIESYGMWQYELIVEVETPSDISNLVQDLRSKLGLRARAISVIPILKVLKSVSFSS